MFNLCWKTPKASIVENKMCSLNLEISSNHLIPAKQTCADYAGPSWFDTGGKAMLFLTKLVNLV